MSEKETTPVENGLFESGSTSSSFEKEKSSLDDEFSADNILGNYTEEEVMTMGRAYANEYGLDEELFAKAAAVARSPTGFNSMEFLSEEDKARLVEEIEHPWRLPKTLYWLVATASMAACVQGMDETVINGANLYFPDAFGIGGDSDRDKMLLGLVNCAPYLCCSCVSCWMSDYLNAKFSRKGVIFGCCVWGGICCIWSAFTNTWWHLFIARFFLGFGIGPNSTTVPVYSSECAPARIRGSLVMNWQIWTAFGIMFGYVMSLAFYKVPDRGIGEGLGWRLMLGSACLPAIVILLQIPFCPESPRWLMGKGRHADAFKSLVKLRNSELQAARDSFYSNVLLLEEKKSLDMSFFRKFYEMFAVRRNRNGAMGAWVCMFMQQFCGVNVISYYSSSIFTNSGFSERDALIASWGFGMLNWVFAAPAFLVIDKFGRRTLLLVAFPLMCVFLLLTGFAFFIPEDTQREARIGVIALGIYLFTIVYSSSEGPVPFTYAAECAALYVRDVTMSFATATCWFFNFILSLTWPLMLKKFKPQGAFGWYAAWNLVGFFLVLWLLPETKGLTLEELDDVFDVPAGQHAAYQTHAILNAFQRKVMRRDIAPLEPLYKKHRNALTDSAWEDKKQAVQHIE
ncbi:hypothetical protein CANARDRAFT_195269 [[Candida] arabinofermentans NRRL YB-2248]|uniref:Major facilitator superfamily (MFS) profile domain-containing protein n=1 Tax=[Candida] arabinofermentans NRRL YB-2248 TaxID=983967 RepID=A0A1E4T4U2_9ASCO|nr:hypothetical protein CANARDRAFT_195269 [[Candida] arabinofermentans NRRL YB-2248]